MARVTDVALEGYAGAVQEEMKWASQDTVWMLSLFGTAIGAGILFLPIDAGLHGVVPLVVMLVLAFPMTYFSHLALCRFVLSSSTHQNFTAAVEEHLGQLAAKIVTLLYFFAIYPILLIYSVAITNTTLSFLTNQMGIAPPSRALLALLLVMSLMLVVRFGQDVVVKLMSILVYPFITVLILLALYLIPYWNTAFFYQIPVGANSHGLWMTLWLLIPVMVFSFNHSPIISAFAINQKERYGALAEEKSSRILKYGHILMVSTVMLFVMSCVLSLSPLALAEAKQQNISILSYLANHLQTPIIEYLAPIIAFVAIAKSFFGHYIGASEGLNGFLMMFRAPNKTFHQNRQQILIDVFMIVTCWLAATINPNILKVIETLGGPIIAIILFLLPMYAIATVPAMKKYAHAKAMNLFTAAVGLIALSAIIYKLC